MYATTRQFLDYFNLKNLDQLPALAEIRDLETLNAELGFSAPLHASLAREVAAEGEQPADSDEAPGLTVVGGTDHVESPEDLPAEDSEAVLTSSETEDELQAEPIQNLEEAEIEAELDTSDESVMFAGLEQNPDFESEAAAAVDPDSGLGANPDSDLESETR